MVTMPITAPTKRHSIAIESKVVTSADAMNMRIAPGGGFAIRLVPTK